MGIYRFDYGDNKIRTDAIIAYVLGVVVAYVLQVIILGIWYGGILTTLIVAAVGGLWYQYRKIL